MKLSKNMYSILLLTITSTILVACGGGSGGSSAPVSGGVDLITFTDFPLFVTAEEGTTVSFDLNASGDGAEELSYEWEIISNNDADITISGQGTDSISFIAPEVDNTSTIRVEVQISSSNIQLIGQDSFSTSVTVINLDPDNEYEVGMTTTLPEVDAIDLSSIMPSSTWLVRGYTKQHTIQEGVNTVISRVTRELFHVTNTFEENTLHLSFCGTQDSFDFNLSDTFDTFNTYDILDPSSVCESGNIDTKFYQENSNFRNELSCDGEVLSATDFIFISDEPRTDFGELEMTFDTYAPLETTSNVCGSIIVANVLQEATELQPATESSASSITLVSEYQNQDIQVLLVLDDSNFFGVYFLDDFFNEFGLVSTTIFSDELPTINGVLNNTSGRFTLSSSSPLGVQGSLTIETTDTNLDEENIEAEFSLSFE